MAKSVKRQMKPRAPKAGMVEHTNYVRTLEMVAEDIVALQGAREALSNKHAAMFEEMRQIEHQVSSIEKRIAECEVLGAALEPFLPKPEPAIALEGEAA